MKQIIILTWFLSTGIQGFTQEHFNELFEFF